MIFNMDHTHNFPEKRRKPRKQKKETHAPSKSIPLPSVPTFSLSTLFPGICCICSFLLITFYILNLKS